METPKTLLNRFISPASLGGKVLVVAGICLCLLLSGKLHGQTYASKEIKDLGLTIETSHATLMEGQVAEITISVGSATQRVSRAIGFELWVDLSDYGTLLPSLSPDMQGSWMSATNCVLAESHDPLNPKRYCFRYRRTAAVDGSGWVLKFQVRASKDNVDAAKIILAAGGIMQIDNLDLRQANPSLRPAIEVWPNPASASNRLVSVRCGGEAPAALVLSNLNGQSSTSFDPSQPMDLQNFASGTYLLLISSQDGQIFHQRIVVQ